MVSNEILKEVIGVYPEILLKVFNPFFGRGGSSQTGKSRDWSC